MDIGFVGEVEATSIHGRKSRAGLLSTLLLNRVPKDSVKGIRALLGDMREGFHFIWNQPSIRFVTVAMAVTLLAAGAFDALIAVYVRDILRSESQVFGALVALVGLGTIIGVSISGKVANWTGVRNLYGLIAGFLVVMGAAGYLHLRAGGMTDPFDQFESLFQKEVQDRRNGSEVLNLADVTVDDEYSEVVAVGIGREHEKAGFLGVVGFRCSLDDLAITKDHFNLATMFGRFHKRYPLVIWIPNEVLHKKNCLEVFHLHLNSLLMKWVFSGEEAKGVLDGGKIIDIAFQATPIEKGNDGFVRLTWRILT